MTENGTPTVIASPPAPPTNQVDFESVCRIAELMNESVVEEMGSGVIPYDIAACAAALLLRRYTTPGQVHFSPMADITFIETVMGFAMAYDTKGAAS